MTSKQAPNDAGTFHVETMETLESNVKAQGKAKVGRVCPQRAATWNK
jgi:hypothetical protein